MDNEITDTIFYAISRDLTLTQNKEIEVALTTPNLFCVLQSITGRMRFINTAGAKDEEYREINILSSDGSENLRNNGFSIKFDHCYYSGGYSSNYTHIRFQIITPTNETVKKDYSLTIDGLMEAVKNFKDLSDSKEDLQKDIKRLLEERNATRNKLQELNAFHANFI